MSKVSARKELAVVVRRQLRITVPADNRRKIWGAATAHCGILNRSSSRRSQAKVVTRNMKQVC